MKSQADREKTWRRISAQFTSNRPELRPLILAAHPDDEAIGASVLLSRLENSAVAFLTDGAPHDTDLWPPEMKGSRSDYAALRRKEALSALSLVGVSGAAIFWLESIDQEAVFDIRLLAENFGKLLRTLRPDVLITHPYEGGHPDHDSAAVVARIALSFIKDPPALLEMTSYHASDNRCVTGEFLRQGESLETSFELSVTDKERKCRMLNAYHSQRLVLENFAIHREPLRLAPEYDFAKPPHEGKLWYERMGWRMTGSRWRELATGAIAEFQEQVCR
jgi:N-acetylglucosamine malate deacetylase 2